MTSVSGLNDDHRNHCRWLAKEAAMLGYRNSSRIHYTQGPRRWHGIDSRKTVNNSDFPLYADCSSFVTWCLWQGLWLEYRTRDTVNGVAWKAGYTGTMLAHGKPIKHLSNVRAGDAVLYGVRGGTGKHTAIVVGRRNSGIPMVISHGSEGGPYFLPYNYRGDVQSIRRYI
jgi:hypothetical protein